MENVANIASKNNQNPLAWFHYRALRRGGWGLGVGGWGLYSKKVENM
jgi:hypothetical protein